MSLSLYCCLYPAPSVMGFLSVFYHGGKMLPSFPPIHENVTGGLLMQYFMAVIYTSQSSRHLKAEQAQWSQFLGVKSLELSPLETQLALFAATAGNCSPGSAAPLSRGHCLPLSPHSRLLPTKETTTKKSFTEGVL